MEALVSVLRELRRVLADDGTLWLNLGDTFSGGRNGAPGITADVKSRGRTRGWLPPQAAGGTGLSQKQLVGIPWRVAFALQADGWYLRSDIIWSKPNPMPESVTDRPTKAHEYVFLLSKSPRYYFDADAVREPYRYDGRNVLDREAGLGSHENHRTNGGKRNRWPGLSATHTRARAEVIAGGTDDSEPMDITHAGRNIRSVWEIATRPYPEAHFATYPEELVRRCILAGCPEGGTVLDPFGGSGTTALVARKHGRKSVLIELNADYCALAAKRLGQLSLLGAA